MAGRNSNKTPLLIYSFNSHFDQCKSVRIWTKFTDSQLGKQGLAIFLIVGEDRDEEDGISSKDGVKMTLVRLGKLYTKDDTMSKSQVFVTTCKCPIVYSQQTRRILLSSKFTRISTGK